MSQGSRRNAHPEAIGRKSAVSSLVTNSTNVRFTTALLRGSFALGQAVSPRLAGRWAEALFFRTPRPRRSRNPLPSAATRLSVRVASGPVAAWSWGQGPAVYLVHGWGGRAEQLGAFVAPLVGRGFRVVAFDGPGHGASAGRRSSGPEIGRALAAVAAQAGPPHAVIAHSLGAAASVFAIREGLSASRLAFLGAPANPLEWAEGYSAAFGLGPETRAAMRRHSERRIQACWDDLPLVPLRGLPAPPPLLVVHDRDDREVAFANAHEIAAAWPGARLQETRGLGHRRVLRDPSVVEAVTDFVSDGMPGARGSHEDPRRLEAREACVHGRTQNASACEACALEAELFAPSLRPRVPAAVPAWR